MRRGIIRAMSNQAPEYFTFDVALAKMRMGLRVARHSWSGGEHLTTSATYTTAGLSKREIVKFVDRGCGMRDLVGEWQPAPGDLLAEDWHAV